MSSAINSSFPAAHALTPVAPMNGATLAQYTTYLATQVQQNLITVENAMHLYIAYIIALQYSPGVATLAPAPFAQRRDAVLAHFATTLRLRAELLAQPPPAWQAHDQWQRTLHAQLEGSVRIFADAAGIGLPVFAPSTTIAAHAPTRAPARRHKRPPTVWQLLARIPRAPLANWRAALSAQRAGTSALFYTVLATEDDRHTLVLARVHSPCWQDRRVHELHGFQLEHMYMCVRARAPGVCAKVGLLGWRRVGIARRMASVRRAA